MRKWGSRSLVVRASLDSRLIKIVDTLLADVADVSLVSGHRSEKEQNELFRQKKSKLEYPQSKHNAYPSLAVDLQPYPYPTYEPQLWGSLGYIAAHAIRIGAGQGVHLRWGGDWDQDGALTDQTFDDLFHLEIVTAT